MPLASKCAVGKCCALTNLGFPGGSVVKNLLANAGDPRDMGFSTGSGRSPEGGNGNPLPYSCLKIAWTEESGRLQSVGSQSQT